MGWLMCSGFRAARVERSCSRAARPKPSIKECLAKSPLYRHLFGDMFVKHQIADEWVFILDRLRPYGHATLSLLLIRDPPPGEILTLEWE